MQKKRSGKAGLGVLLVTGIAFIIGSTVIGIVIKCPTQVQCFLLYTLIGVGMGGIFFNSAEQSTVSYKGLKFSFKIAGCIAVPILLYLINPIDRIKANGCNVPKDVAISTEPLQLSQDSLRKQKPEKMPQLSLDTPKVIKQDSFHPKPPAGNITLAKDKTEQCKGLTKKGTRCKHYTSNANGYCYQHQPG
jgi:hypothetical protein